MKFTEQTRSVQVTAEDIAQGKPTLCANCPVALAVKRTFPEFKSVEVLEEETQFYGPSDATTCRYLFQKGNGEEVTKFIRAFDKKEPVEPFSFDLTVPVPHTEENPLPTAEVP